MAIYTVRGNKTTKELIDAKQNRRPIMKKVIACVLVLFSLSILMISCSKESDIDVGLIEYPGLKWGMTVDEVKAALNIEEDQINDEYKYEDFTVLYVKGLSLFDNPLKVVLFYFLPSENGVYGLGNIEAYFTEDTDMTEVRDTMIGIYGDGDIWTGANNILNGYGELEVSYGKKDPTRFHHYWKASKKMEDVIPSDKMQEAKEYYASVNPKATMKTIDEWVELANVGLIHLVDSSAKEGNTEATAKFTNKCVRFDGSFILQMLQRFGK